MNVIRRLTHLVATLALLAGVAASAHAEDTAISLADGKLALSAPAGWTKKEANPRLAQIIAYEFSIPAAEGDKKEGRATIGPAGGGIEANEARWLSQVQQPDGSMTKDRAVRRQKQVAGCTVHLLDVTGTYLAPQFAPGGGGRMTDYRLLGALVDAGERGAFYVKFIGPQKTVAAHAAEFDKLVDSLQAK